jgi:hypothetical protein
MFVSEIVAGSWKEQNALFLRQIGAKLLDVLLKTNTGECDGALHDVLQTVNVALLQSYLASQLFARYCWLVAQQV